MSEEPKISFKEILEETFSNRSFNAFGGVGSALVTLVMIVKDWLEYNTFNWNSVFVGLILALGYLFLRFLYLLLKQLSKIIVTKYRDSIYGNAFIYLRDGFSRLNYIKNKKNGEEINKEEFMASMIYLCHQIKQVFEKKTKSVCSVSIKIPVGETITADMEVRNLCRDNVSNIRDSDKYRNTKHSVFSNTCFNIIFTHFTQGNREKLYYLNNDIPSTRDYKNTSKLVYENGELPYKSEIVVPIVPYYNGDSNEIDLKGFLCVDSKNKKVFNEKYDIAIIQGVADSIYGIIKEMKKIPSK